MKFIVKIVETTERIIEVEANDYEEAKEMLNASREEAGREIKTEQTEEWYAELEDEKGKEYPRIRWI